MKALFIGGTGVISSACTRLAAERGIDLHLLNRGQTAAGGAPPGVKVIAADVRDAAAVSNAIGARTFDVVANFIAYAPEDVERDLRRFAGKVGQYVFVSSASVYRKPPSYYRVTEATPLGNPYWQYARDKIACEERLVAAHRDDSFPATIVRPSLTYGDTLIPLPVNARGKPWSVVDRMLRGRPVIVPGDGTSLWTCTHNTDFAKGFVPLLGDARAVGEAFHLTSDEVLTWDDHYRAVAAAAGVAGEPRLVHVASETIAAWDESRRGGLLGDKAHSVVFDNTKVRSLVPGYAAAMRFRAGMEQTIGWFRADPARQVVDDAFDRWCDDVIAACERARPG